MNSDRFPVELEATIPLTFADLVRRDRVALVVWDMQKGLAGKSPVLDKIVPKANALIAAADRAGVPVIWSRHILPPLKMTSPPFIRFLMKKQKVSRPSELVPTMQAGMEDTDFVDGMAPAPHHIVLEKSQPSLFVDTPLALRLKAMRVETIVVAGVATDIGIEFTCRHGASLGYHSVVVEDASGAYSQEAHDRSIAFLKSWTTLVVKTDEIIAAWNS